MKKTVLCILLIAMLFSFCACDSNVVPDENTDAQQAQSTEEETYDDNAAPDENTEADTIADTTVPVVSEKTEQPAETEKNLTIDNCPELAAMLANKAEIDDSYSSFATKYKGKIIEFDGRIDYCAKHENYNTRFDYLVSAGDYDPNHQIGPTFKFENVNYYDLNTDLDTVKVGLNVHIVAKVKSFDKNSGLFYLVPISITGRQIFGSRFIVSQYLAREYVTTKYLFSVTTDNFAEEYQKFS